ncbi:septation protein SepH, partial [Nocardioides hankookensis]
MTAPIQHQTHRSDPGTGPAPALAYLRLVGLSEDGTQLRLVDEEGAEHVLAIDDRLRATVVPTAPTAPTAPPPSRGTEKTMESALRPRDIQARIRSGETPEAVAQAAQTSVDKIMAFAAPVLAERQHVAERAQRSSVRR